MVVVAAGSATRFGGEKLFAEVAGKPLISHTIEAVAGSSDIVVVVTRQVLIADVESLGHDVVVTRGGDTRTDSELAGLIALGREYDLIGIHDGARPLVSPALVTKLFETAEEIGGAAPALEPEGFIVERSTLRPVTDVVRMQTPQVFQGPGLMAAYVRAAQTEFVGHDSVEVVQTFGEMNIAFVPGESSNIKVTFPSDLEMVKNVLEDPARNGSR